MRLAAGFLLVCCAFAAPAAFAQQQADASAPPEVQDSPRDPDFGVRTSQPGLERRVEMFQWRQDGGGYAREWSDAWVDSSAFLPGHENPPFPIRARRWEAGGVSVDGMPLDPLVLERLGSWREFRPAFSALPGNLAATFQPQGDGLGSALNPLAPEVGDLRIHWRELVLPPLGELIELRDGRWHLAAGAVEETPAGEGMDAARWWRLLGGVVLVALGFALLRWKRRRKA